MSRLVSEVFESTPGYVRKRMAWLAVAMSVLITLSPVLVVVPARILIQAGWVALAYGAACWVWRRGVRHYSAVGG